MKIKTRHRSIRRKKNVVKRSREPVDPEIEMWKNRVKELYKAILLYFNGRYPPSLLDKRLTQFLKDAEKLICKRLQPNGLVCYRYYLEDYSPEEAREMVLSDAMNFEYGTSSPVMRRLADLARLSVEFADLDKMSLEDKIRLFDKVIHAQHGGGPIFTTWHDADKFNIEEIRRQAEKEAGMI